MAQLSIKKKSEEANQMFFYEEKQILAILKHGNLFQTLPQKLRAAIENFEKKHDLFI